MKNGTVTILATLVITSGLLSTTTLVAQGPDGEPGIERRGRGGPGAEGFGRRGPGGFGNRRGGPGRFGGGGGDGERLIPPSRVLEGVLGFTEAQFAELEVIHEEFRQNVESLVEQKQEIGANLKAELEMEAPSATLIGDLMIAMRDIKRQIQAFGEDFVASFESILTADQLILLEEWKQNQRPTFLRTTRQR